MSAEVRAATERRRIGKAGNAVDDPRARIPGAGPSFPPRRVRARRTEHAVHTSLAAQPASCLLALVARHAGRRAHPRAAMPITGIVVDPSATNRSRARIVARRRRAGQHARVGASPDADGRFRAARRRRTAASRRRSRDSIRRARRARGDATSKSAVARGGPGARGDRGDRDADEAPASQLAASVTVFDQQAIERRQTPLVADLLRLAPGVDRRCAPAGPAP